MTEPKGRAATDEQKRLILDRLYASWCNLPALRLGQLISNAIDKDLFYIEDEDLAAGVEVFQIEAEMRAWEEMSIRDFLEWERKLEDE